MNEHGTQEEFSNELPARPTRLYLSRLIEILSEVTDRDTVVNAVRRARGYAGGKSKKQKQDGHMHTSDESESNQTQSHYETQYVDEDDEVRIEIIEVPDPKLPVRFEKTDDRVKYRKATEPDKTCGDCVFFKYGEMAGGSDGGYRCALVEGRIKKKDTCDLHMTVSEAYSDDENNTDEYTDPDRDQVFAHIPEIENIDEHQVYDLGAITDHRTVTLFTEIPIESYGGEVPSSIPLLPRPGVYKHPRYGDIVITNERNARFVDHINNAVYQEWIPIDAEHQGKLSGAFGWIVGASLNENGSADAQVEWSGRGITALTEKRFRYISPEWLLKYEDPGTGEIYEDVVVGAALTTRPFFKEPALRPLVANEDGIWDVDEEANDNGTHSYVLHICYEQQDGEVINERNSEMSKKDQAPVTDQHSEEGESIEEPSQEQSHSEGATKDAQNEALGAIEQLTENPEKLQQLPKEVQEAVTQLYAMVESQNEMIAVERKTAEQFREQLELADSKIKDMQDDQRRERFTAMVTGRAGEDDGAQWFGDVAKHVNMLEKLAEAFGEDSEEFKDYCETNRAFAAQQQEAQIYKEVGEPFRGSSSAWQQIEAKAQEYREKYADQNMTMQQAISKVTELNPELHQADLAERGLS